MVTLDKHVGEMDAHEMEETVMSPETRTLKQITMDNIDEVNKVFLDLMGENTISRKKFIEENSWKANIDI